MELFSQIFCTFIIGVLVGSFLLEGFVLVPFWKNLPSQTFLEMHHKMGPSLFRYFAPLTVIATLYPLINFWIHFGNKGWWVAGIVALLMQSILMIFFIYFKKANESFKTGKVGAENLPDELKDWERWHWIRTFIAVAAFVLSILSPSFSLS